jgi:hypothetical protein
MGTSTANVFSIRAEMGINSNENPSQVENAGFRANFGQAEHFRPNVWGLRLDTCADSPGFLIFRWGLVQGQASERFGYGNPGGSRTPDARQAGCPLQAQAA